MAGMRDKRIHHDFGVDLTVVWQTVEEDLRGLIPVIQGVIE